MSAKNSVVSLAQTSVASLMVKNVKTIGVRNPVVECIKIMKDADIGSVVVLDETTKPVGIFTERDLVRRIGEKLENLSLPMSRAMTKPLITIPPSATVWDALVLMGKYDIRRLPVMDSKSLVGIVTERDVFRLILSEQTLLLASFSEFLPEHTKEKIFGAVGVGIVRPPARP
jgi:CBS domain-containing protein